MTTEDRIRAVAARMRRGRRDAERAPVVEFDRAAQERIAARVALRIAAARARGAAADARPIRGVAPTGARPSRRRVALVAFAAASIALVAAALVVVATHALTRARLPPYGAAAAIGDAPAAAAIVDDGRRDPEAAPSLGAAADRTGVARAARSVAP